MSDVVVVVFLSSCTRVAKALRSVLQSTQQTIERLTTERATLINQVENEFFNYSGVCVCVCAATENSLVSLFF